MKEQVSFISDDYEYILNKDGSVRITFKKESVVVFSASTFEAKAIGELIEEARGMQGTLENPDSQPQWGPAD